MKELESEFCNVPGLTFAGYIPEEEVPEFFGSSRVCVFDYSSTTGSSGVLHQAATYGCVPVFPMIGDFVDLCRDEGLTGSHYEPGNAQDMAKKILELLEDPIAAQAFADRNLLASKEMPLSEVADFHVSRVLQNSQHSVLDNPATT